MAWSWRQVGCAVIGAGLCVACGTGGPARDEVNVLLITLDTTRADHLGTYGNRRVATPHLDTLAGEGVVFERATTSAPLTLPAHASLMTGSWPMDHGVRDNVGFQLGDEQLTLAELLARNGFATFGAVGSFILHRWTGIAQGFADFDDRFETDDGRRSNQLTAQRDGATVAAAAIAWWEAHPGQRFFVWTHFYDPHHPYEPPAEFARRYPADPYAGEVAYTDSLVGRLLDDLRERGLYESTLIVVVADHGEGLGDHDEPDHGIFLYDTTLRVPLIVRVPGAEYRGRVETLACLADVMPTVVDYLGLPLPDDLRGRSLLAAMSGHEGDADALAYGEAFYARFHYGWAELRSMRDDRFKYIDAPRPELYDLRQDPGELLNVIDLHPELAADLKWSLDSLIEESGDTGEREMPDTSGLDAETLERLRSLGYVGSVVDVDEGNLPDPKDRADSLKLLARAAHWATIHLNQGRFDEAIREVDAALAVEPNYFDGYQVKGQAQRRLGRYAAAIATLERGLKLNPDAFALKHELALCYVALEDWPVAVGLLESVRAQWPRFSQASFSLADVYTAMGRLDDALATLQELAARSPDRAGIHYEIGRTYLERGDLAAAEQSIRRALELEPRIFGAHYNLALVAEAQGAADLAEAEYLEEVALFPAHYEAWTNLGILFMDLGRPQRAEEAFAKVIELQPELSLGYFLLVRTMLETGRTGPETRELARRAVELDPSSERARELLRRLESQPEPL